MTAAALSSLLATLRESTPQVVADAVTESSLRMQNWDKESKGDFEVHLCTAASSNCG